jgi:AcrR family transcriptional regulator
MPVSKSRTRRRTPSQERSRHTVDAILEGAAQVLAERGYAGTTTTRVAERAGVSVGSLYQYFAGKDALITALAERHIHHIEAFMGPELERLETQVLPLDALVRHLVDAAIALHLHQPALHRVLFDESPRPPSVRALERRAQRALVERLARILAAHPEVSVPDPTLAAVLTTQAVEAFCHGFVLDAAPLVEPERMTDEVSRMIRAYLEP